MKCLELFSGAGGLAKGLEKSGFQPVQFIEFNKHACNSLRKNFDPKLVFEGDIRDFSFPQFKDLDLIAGGPPCQPFSLAGKHKAHEDDRDMFPYATLAVTKYQPKAFLFENVKGLLRKTFSEYFDYIILTLTFPSVNRNTDESWQKHNDRLKNINFANFDDVKYHVSHQLINAADYGVPQKRERVFIIGTRADLKLDWTFPPKTHSKKTLDEDKSTGEYWKRHGLRTPTKIITPPTCTQGNLFYINRLKPWVTVRDTLCLVPDPRTKNKLEGHDFREGARQYPGHTGSYIDEPAKTLKAGDHGVPGGENMIRYEDGSVRYFTTYEAKLIQTFDRDYIITGSWGEALRQLGNAVPTKLSETIGMRLFDLLIGQTMHKVNHPITINT
ncbi:MAG: DNA (cytosine-5-)-methyltransferase [Amylibacter sp.]|nr:DNA (cytosine-5-)-methyltransferase [Amylibacter sp.]